METSYSDLPCCALMSKQQVYFIKCCISEQTVKSCQHVFIKETYKDPEIQRPSKVEVNFATLNPSIIRLLVRVGAKPIRAVK